MAWGIDFTADIFLSHQEYNKNTFLVEDAIKECQKEIDDAKAQIKMIGASTPKDITPAEQDPLYYISSEMENSFETIEEQCVKMYKLVLYLEYLQEQEIKEEQPDKVS